MAAHEITETAVAENIDIMHQHRLRALAEEQRESLHERAPCVEKTLRLIADADPGSEFMRFQEVDHLSGEMMHIDHYVVKPLRDKRPYHPLKHRHAPHRHKRLGMAQRPGTQPGAETRRKHHSLHFRSRYLSPDFHTMPCSR